MSHNDDLPLLCKDEGLEVHMIWMNIQIKKYMYFTYKHHLFYKFEYDTFSSLNNKNYKFIVIHGNHPGKMLLFLTFSDLF